jgi:hypothetical protein
VETGAGILTPGANRVNSEGLPTVVADADR